MNENNLKINTYYTWKSSEDYHIIRSVCLKEKNVIKYMFANFSAVIFIIKGKLQTSSLCVDDREIAKGGEMFLIPRGRTFHLHALEDTSMLICTIMVTIPFNQKHPLGTLVKVLKKLPKQNCLRLLPIHPVLVQEIIAIQKAVDNGLIDIDFQETSREMLLLYIRYLYTDEEKAFFFKPLINEDMRFLAKVFEIYHSNITAQEFIERSGMSASTFNRKFKKSFNLSLGKWLIKKKGEEIIEDLTMSDLSVHEIADKHLFTPNHLTKFCNTYFQHSPTEIRENNGIDFY